MMYVVGYCFNSSRDKVLLIRKQRPSWQKGFLNGIGGKVERAEFPIEAMVREFEEEAGVKTKKSDWREFAQLHETQERVETIIICYEMASDEVFKSAVSMTDEFLIKVNTNDLNVACVSNVKWLIQLACDNGPNSPRIVKIYY